MDAFFLYPGCLDTCWLVHQEIASARKLPFLWLLWNFTAIIVVTKADLTVVWVTSCLLVAAGTLQSGTFYKSGVVIVFPSHLPKIMNIADCGTFLQATANSCSSSRKTWNPQRDWVTFRLSGDTGHVTMFAASGPVLNFINSHSSCSSSHPPFISSRILVDCLALLSLFHCFFFLEISLSGCFFAVRSRRLLLI